MALSTLIPTQIAAGQSGANAVTVTITLTDAVAVDQTVLVWGGFQANARTLTGVTDSKGNSYTVDHTNATTGGANSSGIARSVVTVALAALDTITLTFNGAATTAVKTGYAAKVLARLGLDDTGLTGNGTPSNPATWGGGAAALTTTSDDSVIFGGCQSSSGAVTNTPTGSNVELYDTAGAAVEYQITTAKTASVSVTGTFSGASSSYAVSSAAYTPIPSLAAGSWTTSDLASGASHSHPGPADVKGAVVMIEHDTTSSDSVSAVTYGGVAMSRIVTAADTTEAGRVYLYFLDEAAPDGTQNVVVTHSTSTVRIAVASMTCAPGRYIRLNNSGSATAGGSTNPSVNVVTTQGAIGFQAIHSGLDTMVTTMRLTFAPVVAGALGTGSHYDAGTYGAGFGYAYVPVPGTIVAGWSAGTTDDYALIAAFFHETEIDTGRATETDTAGAIGVYRHGIGQATSTESAGAIAPVGSLRAAMLTDNPSAWWQLDELAGPVVEDSIGANDGTIVSGSPGLGHPTIPVDTADGYAMRFDGIDDFVTLPGPTMPGTGSAEFWFEWSGGTAIMRDSTSGAGTGWIFGFDNGGTFAVRLAANTRNSTLTTDQVRDGRRHHLVVTWAPASAPKIYVDGVDVTSTVGNISPTGGTLPWLPGRNGVGGGVIRGRVQHLAFYSSALSAGRVTARYAYAPSAPSTPTTYDQAVTNKRPLGVWKLDETAGIAVADSAGVGSGGNPGTYVGSPTLAQAALVGDGGTSVSFDGVNDEIDMDGVPATVGSWEMWFRWTAGVALGRDASSSILGYIDAGNFVVRIGANDRITTKTSAQVRDGNIHHLVIAWEDTSAKVYLDGVDITGAAWNPGVPSGSTLTVMRNLGFSEWAAGRADRIASYPYMLSSADAAENYLLGRSWSVNQATETDTAGAVQRTGAQTIVTGRASETDSAGRLNVVAGIATETDTAQPLAERITVSQATETDSARPIQDTQAVSQATETDTARAITVHWFPLVDRATETDRALPLTRIVNRANETDTAGAWVTPQFVTVAQATETDTAQTTQDAVPTGRATETDTAGATAVTFPMKAREVDAALPVARVVGRALETDTAGRVYQLIYVFPDTITVEGATVFEPSLITGEPLLPDFWTEPAAEVFTPTLIRGQLLEPDFFDSQLTPTVYEPALVPGQPLEPDFWTAPPATVFDPTIVHSPELDPDFFDDQLAPEVFEPAISAGQLLLPERIDLSVVVFAPTLVRAEDALYPERIENTVVVFEPELRHGQPLRPAPFTGLSVTVFGPRLVQGQPLRPDFFTGLSVTVFEPRLIRGQLLYPGPLLSALSPTVFEPRLSHAQPLYPDFFDGQIEPEVFEPALVYEPDPSADYDETRSLTSIRTAR